MNEVASWLSFVERNRSSIILGAFLNHSSSSWLIHYPGFPFSRDKFTLDELLPHSEAAARYLTRQHFNRARRQIKQKIMAQTDAEAVRRLSVQFAQLNYDERVLDYCRERIEQLSPNGEGLATETYTFVFHFFLTLPRS
jgi:hypothetical protein